MADDLTIPDHFDSAPDPDTGQFTRLMLNKDAGNITLLTAYEGDRQVFSLMPNPHAMFAIGFFRYDLTDLTKNVPLADANYLGSVAYAHPLGEKPTVLRADSEGLVLRYESVKAAASKNVSAADFEEIKVCVSFRKPTDAAAAGWIDFDLEFELPEAVKADAAGTYGWQTRVLYPDFRFLPALVSEYLLLDPLGRVDNFNAAALKVDDITQPKAPMPVPFAAIYELSTANGVNAARGVAVAAADNYGNHKELFHGSTFEGLLNPLAFRYIAPMHLKDGTYTRPAKYKLSHGIVKEDYDADRLFSGAGMQYRVRCFNVGGRLAGVPVDWYDVADLYRKWVKRSAVTRNFRKDIQHPPSPATANMIPHTVAINYSLDGQIDPNPRPDPPIKNNPKIRTWLEVHPVASPPDMTGNTNEPLPALLARIQNEFAKWSADENLGGAIASAPAASQRAPDRLDVFAVGNNKQLAYTGWDGVAWSPWKDLSKDVSLVDRPAPVSSGAGRIDVFARDAADKVYHFHFKSNAWRAVKTPDFTAKALAAASSAPNLVDLFTLDAGNKVQHRSYKAEAFNAATDLGGPASVKLQSLASCFRQPNRLYVFALDDKGALWFRARAAAKWDAGWTPLGGEAQEMPTAVSWGHNRVDVLARGKRDGKLKHIQMDDDVWGKWKTSQLIASSPSVVSPSRNRLELFSRRAADGALLRAVFDTRLEAQLWGFEIGGFYRYLAGLPPATNVINGDPARFRKAMQAIGDQGVLPSATTDPLKPGLSRLRFRGHLLKTAPRAGQAATWVEAIGNRFPVRIEQYLSPATGAKRASTTHVEGAGTEDEKINDRAIVINRDHPDYKAFADSVSARRTHEGKLIKGFGPLTDAFYRADTQSACPVKRLEDAYINLWLKKGLLGEGFRLIEFMKYHYSDDFCYDKSHPHVPEANANYTQAVGYGPWHLERLTSLLKRLQLAGKANDKNQDAAFALSFEFIPLENLVPYLEEFYERSCSTARMFVYALPKKATLPADLVADSTSLALRSAAARAAERRVPVFHFVYSERITQKMDLADMDNLIHPGYKESATGLKAANPMLAPARDDDQNDDAFTFAQWKAHCEQYGQNFKVANKDAYGIAPRDYVTTFNVDAGTATTGSYTYNRGLAATFNLRSWVFRFGAAAVMGERIILPAAWFEPPNAYYAEAIRMGVLGARMQMRFRQFFHGGYMLGQTQILAGNKALWAWRVRRRNFSDVADLVRKADPEVDAVFPVALYDAISRGTDAEVLSPPDFAKYQENSREQLYNAFRITTDKIQHMIWCRDLPAGNRELLYVFANVGNRDCSGEGGEDPKVNFLYSRGLENGAGWKRIVHTFDAGGIGTADEPKDIQPGDTEEINMNARSLSVVRVYQG